MKAFPFRYLPLALLCALLATTFSFSQAEDKKWREGLHYQRIYNADLEESTDSSKIEVIEFFWYGCSHCYTFESLLTHWKKGLDARVAFRQLPAMWNPVMITHAKTFFALKALGKLEDAHSALFTALHVEGKLLNDVNSLAAFLVTLGVDEDKFRRAFKSFGVNNSVHEARNLASNYRIRGTPQIGVNGKYLVSATRENRLSQSDLLKVVDYLIEKERSLMNKPVKTGPRPVPGHNDRS